MAGEAGGLGVEGCWGFFGHGGLYIYIYVFLRKEKKHSVIDWLVRNFDGHHDAEQYFNSVVVPLSEVPAGDPDLRDRICLSHVPFAVRQGLLGDFALVLLDPNTDHQSQNILVAVSGLTGYGVLLEQEYTEEELDQRGVAMGRDSGYAVDVIWVPPKNTLIRAYIILPHMYG